MEAVLCVCLAFEQGMIFFMTQGLNFLSLFEKQLFFSLFQSLRDSLTCKFHGIIINIYFIQTQRVNIYVNQ